YLNNPFANVGTAMKEYQNAADRLGLRLVILNVSTPSELESAFSTLVEQRIDALLPGQDFFFMDNRTRLVALAERYGMPAIYTAPEYVETGGLVSYGANLDDATRLAGTYSGRILKGEKSSDMPVQQSARIEMVVNLKTAKALRLDIPPNVLAIADEVIE